MQATNMVLIVLTCFYHSHIMKNAPTPVHVFKPTRTIFKLVRDIIGTHCFNKFHEDRTINVASRVLKSHIKKNAPPPGTNVFQPTGTNFELAQRPYLLTEFHDDGQ
ncbi:hypothetical protein DPMN_057958 [Dreissena polymorpha]|uniref:Uncharacterized protein n=1 Tax=Dreissena polymorpha TaxID=45954 RepID=A0A9D4C173_DREPO|nr:hypothetical protein DPMN_057958 [Dreissena polymorpha]